MKTQATIMLDSEHAYNFDKLLLSMFYRSYSYQTTVRTKQGKRRIQATVSSEELAKIARDLLAHIKSRERQGLYRATEWREYIKTHGLTLSQYESVLAKLKALGLIQLKSECYRLSERFERRLSEIVTAVKAFREGTLL